LRTGHTAFVGNTNNANGVLEINGATIVYNNRSGTAAQDEAFRGTLTVGNAGTSRAGVVRFTSGSLSLYRQLALGGGNTAYGAYRQSGGTATVGGFLALGLGNSTGVFSMTAGSYTGNGGPVTNGAGGSSNGLIDLRGSAVFQLTAAPAAFDNALWIAESGSGVVNVADNATLETAVVNNGIQLGRNASGVGTLNLNGGVTRTKAIFKGAGTGTLNLNGGVLEANQDNATFVSGLTNAFVRPGGAIIETSAFNVTIPQALLAPIGTGITSIALTTGGSGYLDAPVVTFAGGTGAAATAVANMIDDGSGNGTLSIASISITNPGDYSVLPTTIGLAGGGNGAVAATLGALASAVNASGGLTKSGPGTLTLTGANTYAGHTTVSGGLLSISTAYLHDLSNVLLASGSQMNLNFVGTDTINALYLGGVGQAAGTWGATGSGAANINDTYFTGTGVLLVSVPEPSSCLLGLGGVMALLGAGRRRS
jgi:autotransporter-associated beta strand protein